MSDVAVNPPTVNATLKPGKKMTVAKTVVSPAFPPKSDIVFLADTTGSMSASLQNVKENAKRILELISASQPTAQFAVADYKDREHSWERDAYDYHVGQNLTENVSAAVTAINAWTASGGGDKPENQLLALYRLAIDAISWRANSTPIIVWFGDAPGHDDSPSLGQVIHALQSDTPQRKKIKVIAISVTSGVGSLGTQADDITRATDGTHLTNADPTTVADLMLESLQNLDITVSPKVVNSSPLVITFDQSEATVKSGEQVEFTETIELPADPNLTGKIKASCYVKFLDKFTGELLAESAVQNIGIDISAPITKELVVHGTDKWLDTGLDIAPRDEITITATGKWRNDGRERTYWVDANGFDTYKDPGSILPDVNFASLIGRLGESGAPFFVGSNFGPSSPGSGRLFLQMNDVKNNYFDNEGKLNVVVKVA